MSGTDVLAPPTEPMSAAPPPAAETEAVVAPSRRPLTAAEFRAMATAGIFAAGERVELVDGVLYDMFAVNPPHNAIVGHLEEEVHELLGRRYTVKCQGAVEPDPNSQPLPDLAVLRRRDDHYSGAHAGPADTLLLIEVADSSLAHDTEVKAPAYARDGIAETWVVSIPGRQVIQYADPAPDGYLRTVRHPAGASLTATAVPELTLDTGAMFAVLPPG